MLIFGLCFILYFLKLSAGYGFLCLFKKFVFYIQAEFKKYDVDGSGDMSMYELQDVMEALGKWLKSRKRVLGHEIKVTGHQEYTTTVTPKSDIILIRRLD